VLSKEQQLELIAEAKRKRAEAAREKNRQQNKKSTAPMKSQGMARYASKLGGALISDHSDDWLGPAEWEEQQRKAEDARLAAEMHKEKLLDFQRTGAKRTTVIGKLEGFFKDVGDELTLVPCSVNRPFLLQIRQRITNFHRMVVIYGYRLRNEPCKSRSSSRI
jgi:hypothetical protein